jgi:hypothetical protein
LDASTTPVEVSTSTPSPTIESRERSTASATFDGGKVGLVAGIIGAIVAILALGSFLYYHTKKEKKIVEATRIDLHNVPSKEQIAPAVPTMATYEIEVEVPAESVSGSTFTGGDYLVTAQGYDRRPSNVSQLSYGSHAHYMQGPPPPASVPYEAGYHYDQDYYHYQNAPQPYYSYGPGYTQPDPYYQGPPDEGSELSQVPAALLHVAPPVPIVPSPENASNVGGTAVGAPANGLHLNRSNVQEESKSPVHKGFSTL